MIEAAAAAAACLSALGGRSREAYGMLAAMADGRLGSGRLAEERPNRAGNMRGSALSARATPRDSNGGTSE
jgi:hypothetical protein